MTGIPVGEPRHFREDVVPGEERRYALLFACGKRVGVLSLDRLRDSGTFATTAWQHRNCY